MIAAGYNPDGTVKAHVPVLPDVAMSHVKGVTAAEWCARLKEAAAFKEESETQTWARTWWGGLDYQLRACLMAMVIGDRYEQYQGVLWASLPIELRDDLMLLGRTIERSFRGAPWR